MYSLGTVSAFSYIDTSVPLDGDMKHLTLAVQRMSYTSYIVIILILPVLALNIKDVSAAILNHVILYVSFQGACTSVARRHVRTDTRSSKGARESLCETK